MPQRATRLSAVDEQLSHSGTTAILGSLTCTTQYSEHADRNAIEQCLIKEQTRIPIYKNIAGQPWSYTIENKTKIGNLTSLIPV